MAGKKTDFEGMIAVYDTINKTRALTEAETDRLEYLTKRLNAQRLQADYRARNKELLKEKKDKWRNKPENKKKLATNRMRYYYKHHGTELRRGKEWRENNPDKVKKYKDTQKEKDQRNQILS